MPLVYATYRIIRSVNGSFAELFGYEREELKNQSFSMLYPELTDFVMIGDMWRHNLAGGRSYADERIMLRRDGTRFWCRVRGRSMEENDPFSKAIYCFDALPRPVRQFERALSPRQHQIVTLVAQGKTNAEIATELSLSQRTVETHRYRLMRQTGLKNAAELAAWFADVGRPMS